MRTRATAIAASCAALLGHALATTSELAPITDALEGAALEIETGVFPALATVLGLLVVVAIAVSVAGVVARGR